MRSPQITRKKKRNYTRPSTRGLGPDGGGWSIQQASRWSGIGEHRLRAMAERNEIPHLKIGRRILIPRQAFTAWFNGLGNQRPVA